MTRGTRQGEGRARGGFARAVVSGGAGFLGTRLCERLVALGTEVVCLDNFVTARPDSLVELGKDPLFRAVDRDVTTAWEVSGEVDLVVHLASAASPRDYARMPLETMWVGAQGTRLGLELATERGARFLLASTSEVYGDPLQHPQGEDYRGNVSPTGPRSVYDEAKRYAEALTTAYRKQRGTDAVIARIFNTYGPGMRADDGRLVPTLVDQALGGRPLTVTGTGTQTRSLCYVDDTVRGLLTLAASDCSEPVNIGNPWECSVDWVARLVRELCGSSSPIEYVPAFADDPRRRCPDISRAVEKIGWNPGISLREGMSRTVAWFAGFHRADAHGE
ncbi:MULTISPECIES: NAD-dependent epimerase/dehydratase family protein [unclassified Actinopolyspora]|uniref:NAD-dependent epimerase/dehydratase family protein n=1 Tax=unclassified Actinopolyspora TaxID=2639451 RepID=UPI0013F5C980|nr:NAD-dependent epimerase/dehydratase family protein [Actinopolyspora sp. BKK2]NHE74980.1 NAD-dependent epimerase/dehydratase family protein [Actinopolyspora sp. BKK1]